MVNKRYIPFSNVDGKLKTLVAESGYQVIRRSENHEKEIDSADITTHFEPIEPRTLKFKEISMEELYIDIYDLVIELIENKVFKLSSGTGLMYEDVLHNRAIEVKLLSLVNKYGTLSSVIHSEAQSYSLEVLEEARKKYLQFERTENATFDKAIKVYVSMLLDFAVGEKVEVWIGLINYAFESYTTDIWQEQFDLISSGQEKEALARIQTLKWFFQLYEFPLTEDEGFQGNWENDVKRFLDFKKSPSRKAWIKSVIRSLLNQLNLDINNENDNFIVEHSSLGSAFLIFSFNYGFPKPKNCKECRKPFIDRSTRKNKIFCTPKCKMRWNRTMEDLKREKHEENYYEEMRLEEMEKYHNDEE